MHPEPEDSLCSRCHFLGSVGGVRIAYPSNTKEVHHAASAVNSDDLGNSGAGEDVVYHRDRSPEEQVIDQVETAQLAGRLALSSAQAVDVVLGLHGLRLHETTGSVMDFAAPRAGSPAAGFAASEAAGGQDSRLASAVEADGRDLGPCIDRVPLQTIAEAVLFEDDLGRTNLAILIGLANPFKCIVLQYPHGTEVAAKRMVQSVQHLFGRIEKLAATPAPADDADAGTLPGTAVSRA